MDGVINMGDIIPLQDTTQSKPWWPVLNHIESIAIYSLRRGLKLWVFNTIRGYGSELVYEKDTGNPRKPLHLEVNTCKNHIVSSLFIRQLPIGWRDNHPHLGDDSKLHGGLRHEVWSHPGQTWPALFTVSHRCRDLSCGENFINKSMGDLQDPTDGGTVPYKYHFSGHFFWGYSLKLRPYYPGMAIEQDLEAFPKIPRVTKKSKKPWRVLSKSPFLDHEGWAYPMKLDDQSIMVPIFLDDKSSGDSPDTKWRLPKIGAGTPFFIQTYPLVMSK